MADLIQFKRASLATWEKLDYVLEVGEPGFVKDADGSYYLKIGDGTTPWSQLPYVSENIFNALTPSIKPNKIKHFINGIHRNLLMKNQVENLLNQILI